ncbi:cupredoxin superfamily protein [Actinidia rufa]|uniref:Cupredoxin superfamily protein n=1 Tax=Actinidia rufa TaxID=165716 RepID=A0A7J0FCP5_9ERIC|nr:cupredoxin superfamily protein [Actinidia rufa]
MPKKPKTDHKGVFTASGARKNSATAPGLSPGGRSRPGFRRRVVSSSPAFSWPFQPRESELAPSPSPSTVFPATSPSLLPEKGDGIPFINSNPAVPLPTGEVDSATIRPLPTSGHRGQVVGLFAVQMALCFVVLLLLL